MKKTNIFNKIKTGLKNFWDRMGKQDIEEEVEEVVAKEVAAIEEVQKAVNNGRNNGVVEKVKIDAKKAQESLSREQIGQEPIMRGN